MTVAGHPSCHLERARKEDEVVADGTETGVPEPVHAHFDGLCQPKNPGGYACGGWTIDPHLEVPGLTAGLAGGGFYIKGDGATNNVAEFRAALDVLTALVEVGYRGPVVLYGDSQIVVYQFKEQYKCRNAKLQPLLAQLRERAALFSSFEMVWVERESNEEADEQSRLAYKRAIDGEA